MSDLFPLSLGNQTACVEREIAMRLRVYPRQVAAGRMTQGKADREIALMRAVLQTLEEYRSYIAQLEQQARFKYGEPPTFEEPPDA